MTAKRGKNMDDSDKLIPGVPGETSKWYSRFLAFIHLGCNRSILAVYKQEKAGKSPAPKDIPGSWKDAVKKFDWQGRAKIYDASMLQREAEEFEDVRRLERKRKFDLLQKTRIKLERMIKKLSTKAVSWGEYSHLLKIFLSESREEFDLATIELRIATLEKQQP
jgi:hypothetical protein